MINRSIALLLILLTGISPAASALAYCPSSGNTGVDRLSSDSMVIEAAIDNPMSPGMLTTQVYDNHSGMGCDSSGSCVFHLCGGCGLAVRTLFYSSFSSNPQAILADVDVKEVTLSPEIKPPIHIL